MCYFIKYYNIYYIALSHFLSTDFFVKCRNFCANLQKNERISVYMEFFGNFVGYFQKPQRCGKLSKNTFEILPNSDRKTDFMEKILKKTSIFR